MVPPLAVVLAVPVALVLLFAAERYSPLRRARAEFVRRLPVNLLLAGMTLVLSALLVQPVAVWLAGRPSPGLLPRLPPALRPVVGFLLLDLTFYWWHRANHVVPLLWGFHAAHHSDPDMDVTTAIRFHPGEIVFSLAFRTAQVALIGASIGLWAAYELVFQLSVLLHHANLRLPLGIERALNLVLVTPRMHGIHHSQVRDEANANYATVLTWWDRLHRTLRLNVPQAAVTIGLPALGAPRDNVWTAVLAQPFRRVRSLWLGADGNLPRRDPALLDGPPARLAA
jgi:sterol desaturase/sphingolipid hydroxylase (fatty acid hydroxylase superfamily)